MYRQNSLRDCELRFDPRLIEAAAGCRSHGLHSFSNVAMTCRFRSKILLSHKREMKTRLEALCPLPSRSNGFSYPLPGIKLGQSFGKKEPTPSRRQNLFGWRELSEDRNGKSPHYP